MSRRKLPQENPFAGDVWTWVAIDADTKLIPSWIVGPRDGVTARIFVNDLAGRLGNRIQLTSDGLKRVLTGCRARVSRTSGLCPACENLRNTSESQKRYSPAECVGCERKTVTGRSRSQTHNTLTYVERQNLTMRMSMRRFTRLTNAFSKKIENHVAMVALHFMYYNFARIHQTLEPHLRWKLE